MNNSVQLSADICSLQDRLVTTLKGANIKIDNEQIHKLYEKYNVDLDSHKIQMKIVLQRYVLETILKFADNYLEIKEEEDPDSPYNQEKYIISYTNKLIDLLNKFYSSHFRQDNCMIRATQTKICQQVYGMLGAFGFSEIYENNDKCPHPFTTHAKQELNQLMTKHHHISDVTKRNSIENMAEDLIKDVVRIFKFRLLVQEPKCEVRWYENSSKIDTQFMKGGQWDDENLDDYVVNIC